MIINVIQSTSEHITRKSHKQSERLTSVLFHLCLTSKTTTVTYDRDRDNTPATTDIIISAFFNVFFVLLLISSDVRIDLKNKILTLALNV